MSESAYNELRSQLQKHKENQRVYREKIKEVNTTRSKINDQLELLQQTYDKKIKQLEHKLDSLRQHNEALTKQNILFRTEIDTYQTRLVEKEKIIALLLQQKKDVNHLNSSDKSKSDKTDSLQANEEEKIFKKQPLSAQEVQPRSILSTHQIDLPHSQKPETEKDNQQELIGAQNAVESKIVPPPPKKRKENHPRPTQQEISEDVPEPVKQPQQPEPVRKAPPPPNRRKENPRPTPEEVPEYQPEPENQAQHPEPVRKTPPPPPAPRKGVQRKTLPKKQARNAEDEGEGDANDSQLLMSYFSANSHHNLSDSRDHGFETKHAHEPFGPVTDHQYEEVQNHAVQDANLAEQEIVPAIETYQNEEQLNEARQGVQQYTHPEKEQQYNWQGFGQAEVGQYSQQEYNPQVEPTRTYDQEEENKGDFLAHFNKNREESMGELTQPKAIKKKPKKQHKVYQQTSFEPETAQQTTSPNDFFNQLSHKQEAETPHPLDIQESSIDHADRDSSLISNEQAYFAEDGALREQQRPKPKAVKMTKKKGKRDQIKVADPSLFE